MEKNGRVKKKELKIRNGLLIDGDYLFIRFTIQGSGECGRVWKWGGRRCYTSTSTIGGWHTFRRGAIV